MRCPYNKCNNAGYWELCISPENNDIINSNGKKTQTHVGCSSGLCSSSKYKQCPFYPNNNCKSTEKASVSSKVKCPHCGKIITVSVK